MAIYNECVKAILGELEKFGLDGFVTERGKHQEVAWMLPTGARRFVFTATTPSDHRAPLNERAKVRRMLRQDNVKVPEKTIISFQKAMQLPKPVPTLDDRFKQLYSDIDGLIDLTAELQSQLDIAVAKLNSMQVITTVTFGQTGVKEVLEIEPEKVPVRGVRAISSRDTILQILSDMRQHSTADIISESKLDKAVVNQALLRNKKAGLVENVSRGYWRKVPTHSVNGSAT